MDAAQKHRMTADEFIAWSMAQPKGRRYELASGEVVQMASERAKHARVKMRVCRLLEDGVASQGLGCEVFPDGMAIRIDANTVYEPDCALRCGTPLGDEAVHYSDPVIVVEVLSPSSQAIDTSDKLADYFRLPSVAHYLVVRTNRNTIIHHRRGDDGMIQTRLVTTGALRLDPPGIRLDLDSLFQRPD